MATLPRHAWVEMCALELWRLRPDLRPEDCFARAERLWENAQFLLPADAAAYLAAGLPQRARRPGRQT